jgi:hypothetical protein
MSPGGPDPAEDRPRPLLGLAFWALMIFSLLCVLAGAGVVLLGPRLRAPTPTAPPPAADAPHQPSPG